MASSVSPTSDEGLTFFDCEDDGDDFYDDNDSGFFYGGKSASGWPLKSSVDVSAVTEALTAAAQPPKLKNIRSQDVLNAVASVTSSQGSRSPTTPSVVASTAGSKESFHSAQFPATHRLAPTYKAFPTYEKPSSRILLVEDLALGIVDSDSLSEPLLPKVLLATKDRLFPQDEHESKPDADSHVIVDVDKRKTTKKKSFSTVMLRKGLRNLVEKMRRPRQDMRIDDTYQLQSPSKPTSVSQSSSTSIRPSTSAGITDYFSTPLESPLPPNRLASRSMTSLSMIALPRSSSLAKPLSRTPISKTRDTQPTYSAHKSLASSNPNLAFKNAYQAKIPAVFGPKLQSNSDQDNMTLAAPEPRSAAIALASTGAELINIAAPHNIKTPSNKTSLSAARAGFPSPRRPTGLRLRSHNLTAAELIEQEKVRQLRRCSSLSTLAPLLQPNLISDEDAHALNELVVADDTRDQHCFLPAEEGVCKGISRIRGLQARLRGS